jgi:tetratricopeptide (TPR) repeat protein
MQLGAMRGFVGARKTERPGDPFGTCPSHRTRPAVAAFNFGGGVFRHALAVGLCLLWLLGASVSAQTPDYTGLLGSVAASIINKNYPRAIELASKGLDGPRSPEERAQLLRFRADAFDFSGQSKQAEDDYTSIVELGLQGPRAYVDRGNFYLAHNRFDEALRDFEAGAKLFPSHAPLHFGKGRVAAARRQYADAVALYSDAIRLDPNNAEYLLWRAEALGLAKQYQQALAEYDQALAHGGLAKVHLAQLRTGRGVANLKLGNANNAIADFDRAIELFADHLAALRWRGHAFEMTGRLDQARADYERVLALRPKDKWALERMQDPRGK